MATVSTYTYEVKADAKGRVKIPAGLKKELSSFLNEGFIIKRSVFFNCLELYPQSEWNKELAEIEKLNRFEKKKVAFIRRYVAGLKQLQVDANDRFLIPKELIDFAGLKKNIVLSPQITKIEIWDKENYENDLTSDEYDMESLTEEVMGSSGSDQPADN